MKTQEEIEKRIRNLHVDIQELHEERNEKKEAFGGISEEENEDFLSDINYKWAEIKTLEWILS